MLKVTYLSHSGFLCDDGNYKVLIDPFISGNPNAPLGIEEIEADFVVLTHAHGDHLGDAIEIAKKRDATIVAVNELANYVAEKGAKAHNMHIGGGYDFPFGRLKFTIAHHGSSSPEGGSTVYHAGDTGLFYDMKLIGDMNNVDLFCVPIGDNFTMGIDDAVKAVEFVDPALCVPIHYNTFPVIQTDPEKFRKIILSNERKCKVMDYGETIEI